jgi:hypothetical protein
LDGDVSKEEDAGRLVRMVNLNYLGKRIKKIRILLSYFLRFVGYTIIPFP